MKKSVFLTSRNTVNDFGEEYYSIQISILSSLIELDYLPIPIFDSNSLNYYKLKDLKPELIVLTGGEDPGLNPRRDTVEVNLLEYSISANVPVLGICRGMQQFLHFYKHPPTKIQNHVNIKHQIEGDFNLAVNSYHNYGYYSIPENFQVLAKSLDGSIEAIFESELKWLGIMWHPERMSTENWLKPLINKYFQI